ncbi:J domain-containing protein [Plasmodiophora brassicae]|nr:hypothetical protein PBRA_007400 [Plasmodiophora brassicae]
MASDAMSIDDDDESNIVAGDSDRPAKRVRVDHRRSAAKRLAETDAAADSEWCSPKRYRARAEREPPHAYDAPPAKRTRSSLVFRKEHEPSRDVSGRRARAVRTTIALHNVLRSDLRSFSALQRLDDRRLWAQTSPTIEARASATGTAALVPRRSPPPDSRRRRDPGEDRVQQFRDEQATNRTMAETKSRLQERIGEDVSRRARGRSPRALLAEFAPDFAAGPSLRRAFRRALLAFHPDRFVSSSSRSLEEIVEAEEIYKVLQPVYESL